MAVLLAVAWFYPAGLSCPESLVRTLKHSIRDYFQKSAEIVKYIHLLKYTDQKLA